MIQIYDIEKEMWRETYQLHFQVQFDLCILLRYNQIEAEFLIFNKGCMQKLVLNILNFSSIVFNCNFYFEVKAHCRINKIPDWIKLSSEIFWNFSQFYSENLLLLLG